MCPNKCTLNLKKKYQEKSENAYLIVKNVRVSRALGQALDQPIMARFASLTLLRSPDSTSLRGQNLGKYFWGLALDQILDPLVNIPSLQLRKQKYKNIEVYAFVCLQIHCPEQQQ